MKGKKVGLALGGGSARGLSHIGVLEVLEKEGIPVDMIAGTSIGALIGALYAENIGISRIHKLAVELGAKKLSFMLEPAWPRTGLIRGRRIDETMHSVIGDIEFSDLRLPFACVATDFDTGDEVVMRDGKVWDAVRASASVPVMLSVARRGKQRLLDGGLVNPVPVSALKEMGADFIIAVNVMPNKCSGAPAEPSVINVIWQTLNIASYRLLQSSLAGADVVIEPMVGQINFAAFERAEECILEGAQATSLIMPVIKQCLSGVMPHLARTNT